MKDVVARFASLSPAKQALLQKARQAAGGDEFTEGVIPRRASGGTWPPLSFAQQRLWFLDQLEGPGATYNMPNAIRLNGPLNLPSFEAVFQEIVRRHEVLRTNFIQQNGLPVQLIHAEIDCRIPVVDLQNLPEAQQESEFTRLAEQQARHPFNLAQDRLLRLSMIRLATDRHVLLFNIHHIVSDGWSNGNVLLREVLTLYSAFSQGKPSPLPALPIQYADFACWQRQWLSGQRLDNQIAYWQKQLSGIPTLLELPTDRPRPPIQTFTGTTHYFTLEAALLTRMKTLGQTSGATLFMTLQAGFAALLARYSRQETIVVGSPIANRQRKELEPLMGFFVNTLVLRTEFTDSLTGHELLAQVRHTCLQAYRHQDVPFERLVEAIRPERNLSFSPLFQVMFILQNQNEQTGDLHIGDLRISTIPQTAASSMFDMTLKLEEQNGALLGEFEYNTDLFDAATIERFVAHYHTLLTGIAMHPDSPVAGLPLLDQCGYQQLVRDWNATQYDYPLEQTVYGLFEQQALQHPDRIAVIWENEQLSYGLLNARANLLAGYLSTLGATTETLVGLCVERSAELLVGLLGIMKTGAAYVPLDPAYPKERLNAMIASSGLSLLLTQQAAASALPAGAARIVFLDRDWPSIAATRPTTTASPIRTDRLAYVIYTSGSTGRPKGVQISHRALLNFLFSMRNEPGLGPDDTLLAVTTICFDIASLELYLPLITGGRIALASRETAADGFALRETINRTQATVMQATPATWRLLFAAEEPTSLPLRRIFCGGEALTGELAQQLLQTRAQVWNLYGPTETTVWSTASRVIPRHNGGEFGGNAAIGHPIANTQTYIVDRFFQPLPIGIPGELYIGGDGLSRGYLGQAAMTAERFLPDPFAAIPGARVYKTGDLVRFLNSGQIAFLGRVDHQIKIRGFRIELGEIEAVLSRHPAVLNAVAICREDRADQQQLLTYVEADFDWRAAEADTAASEVMIEKWQTVWEQTYRTTRPPSEDNFDTSGWLSSYTGKPIPKLEMQAWVDDTVARILALQPSRVMEIGCGTGLLLSRLAPRVQTYVGVDFSAAVLEGLRRKIETWGLSGVQLQRREANQFSPDEAQSCDTIIINSVIQYFPGLDYLLTVLEGAINAIKDGGCLFLGDLRTLPLLELQHASVQFHQAAADCGREELSLRVAAQTEREEELLLDPRFFAALQARLPRISAVEFFLKHGTAANEMIKFRYDAVLRIGGEAPLTKPASPILDAEKQPLSLADLQELLSAQPETLLVKNLLNRRLTEDARILEWLRDGVGSVGDLRTQLRHETPPGVDPEALCELGESLAYTVALGWAADEPQRRFDAVFYHLNSRNAGRGIRIAGEVPADSLARYINNPGRNAQARRLTTALRQHLEQQLPAYMLPSAIVFLDKLPLTANGKIDRRALPAPDLAGLKEEYQPPRNEDEQGLAAIWTEVLAVERIGVNDNFFTLGGHSLLAVQVISKVRDAFNVELPIQALFDAPTIALLSERLSDGANGEPILVPVRALSPSERSAAPLSFAQQRLWFLDQLEGASVTYHISGAARLTGKLNVTVLEGVFSEIVRRHEVLRTRFSERDGNPIQTILPPEPFRIQQVSLQALTGQAREQEILHWLSSENQRPFILAEEPLLRVTLLRLDETCHLLLMTLHHIVSDEWSIGLLLQEMADLYLAFDLGQASPLPELPIQYADYALWQRQWLSGPVLEKQSSYWAKQLAGAADLLDLPTDRPRPPVQRYRGSSLSFSIAAGLTEQLKQLGRSAEATLFMTLLAAYAVLLARYARTTDLVIGSPIANRNRGELEQLIGFFVNTLPLRLDLSGNPSSRQLLSRIRQTALAAYAHQDLPFEYIVEELQPQRNLSHAPLFQVMFVLQNAPAPTVAVADLSLEMLESAAPAAKFDLTLSIEETSGELRGVIEYNTDLFNETTMLRFIAHYRRLLASMAATPHTPVMTLPLLDEAEQRQIVFDWNSSPSLTPPQVMPRFFEARAAQTPDKIALVHAGANLSYAALNKQANRVAHQLRTLGIGPEVAVGLCLEPSFEMIIGLLAILKAGGAYLPLLPETPPERLAFMLAESQSSLILTNSALAESLSACGTQVLNIDELLGNNAPDTNPDFTGHADNLAYIIYTSGSSGQPKGVQVSHGNLAHSIQARLNQYAAPLTGLLLLQPIAFDIASGAIFWSLCQGGSLFLEPRNLAQDPRQLLDRIAQTQVSHLILLPLLYSPLLDLATTAQLANLNLVIVGGEQMPVELATLHRQLVPHAALYNEYGPTEASIWCSAFQVDEDAPCRTIPIGKPNVHSRLYLLDEWLHPLPVGVAGELYIGGEQVSRGYQSHPALSAEKFIPDPFAALPGARLYRSGDIGRYRGDGNIEFQGRVDQQVKIRGFRIELGEIEAALKEYDYIAEAAVVVNDQLGSKRLVAYLIVEAGGVSDSERIRAYLRTRLSDYMIPAAFVFLDSLPLTANGKLDQRALPAPERGSSESNYLAPRTATETLLANLWQDVLGLAQIGVQDNFFSLGGDSILSIQIVSRANRAGLGLTVKQLFQHQTIAELARVAPERQAIHAEQRTLTGPVELTPIQIWFFEGNSPEPQYFNQSVLLKLVAGLDPTHLERAVQALINHHDMLRARFHWQDGPVRAEIVGCGQLPFSVHDYSGLPPERRQAALSADALQQQTRLNLSEGPLLRAIFYRMGDNQTDRLLLIIHHLVVDGVSWRILLGDLDTALNQLSRAEPIELAAKTSAFPYWSQRLKANANSEQALTELAYWREQATTPTQQLPLDSHALPDANTLASAEHVTLTLSADLTRALLLETPQAYRSQINDVLLTALLRTVNAWTGDSRLRIVMEGHGREELFDDVDLSRTVGWFTSGFPLLLQGEANQAIGSSLKQIKETLRRIPKHGIGYGVLRYLHQDPDIRALLATNSQAEISFNYLGSFEQNAGSTILLGEASEPTGSEQSQIGPRRFVLEINAILKESRLQLTWTYSKRLHKRPTIERLANSYFAELEAIIHHCRSEEAGGYTASDFPLAAANEPLLNRLFQLWGSQVEDAYPLSPMQRGMWFHSLYAGDSGAYIIQLTGKMTGEFQPLAFQRAWQRVLDRHPSLRTAIVAEGGEDPLQVVINRVDLPWQELDWRDQSAAQQQTNWAQWLKADRAQGFSMDRAPLMRCCLARLDENTWQFLWSHHHLLTDGWCLPILMREVLNFYRAFVSDRDIDLTAPRPYRHYIAWLQQQDLSQAQSFWRETLRGFSAPTGFGVDRPPNPVGIPASAEYRESAVTLDADTSQALQQFAQSRGLTLSVLIQGVWGVLLSAYSGMNDVLFGATVSGRPPEIAEVDTMIGLFINTLPVRIQLDSAQLLLDFFTQLRDTQLTRDAYAYTPLVTIQACSEIAPRQPLFESIVVFENYPMDSSLEQQAELLAITDLEIHEQTNFPLTLTAANAAAIPLKIAYDSSRFEEHSIRRLLNHLGNLLRGLVAAQLQTVGQWSGCLIAAEERKQLLLSWNQSSIKHPEYDHSLADLFEAQVRRTPFRIAAIFADQQLSYDRLNRRANQVAHRLRALGVGPGVLVALCMERSLEMLIGLLGIQKAGGAYLPLDPAYPTQRLAFMLEDSQATVILGQQHLSATLPATHARLLCLDENDASLAAFSDANPVRRSAPRDLAYVIYTSGSTGRPKGVQISQGALVNFLMAMAEKPGLTQSDVLLGVTTLSFDIAGLELYLPLIVGAKLALVSRAVAVDGAGLLAEMQRVNATLMQATPITWRLLLEAGWQGAPLQTAFCGGEGLPQDLALRMLQTGIETWNLYGPTETTVWSSTHPVSAQNHGEATQAIGRPIDNTRLYVVDRFCQPAPMGVPGELLIGGAGLAQGYLGRPGLTAERFVPDPFGTEPGSRLYRTGDQVRYREDGNLSCLGRIDQQIKIRGFRIELGEIEALLNQHAGVKQAVVSVWEAGVDDKRLIAYLLAKPGTKLDAENLRDGLKQHLPAYMLPTDWLFLDSLPQTPNGKLDRAALPVPNRQRRAAYTAPRTKTEAKLAELMSEVLAVKQAGVDDDFFELGGHSLLAAKLVTRIAQAFQLAMPLPVLFQKPTIEQLAEYIDTTLWAARQGATPEAELEDDEEEFRW
ncbi:non-ribosomal peptide synthetase [Methylomonas albis]|uniref:Amino acid adenylation domain-containing protein n=1 Tax=Methylomonas albis TaxID=1854563 RepID=A0ABR9D4K3_9GAMM|nr:non-ribosomal peptide synthetase [Methylomonas albis]MBD9358038.1 amino acid adenylation domain-containing protein [Methylomonas albis]